MTDASFEFESNVAPCRLHLRGDWLMRQSPEGAAIYAQAPSECKIISVVTHELTCWDSSLVIAILSFEKLCSSNAISVDTSSANEGLQQLLSLANIGPGNAVKGQKKASTLLKKIHKSLTDLGENVSDTIIFVGMVAIAIKQWISNKAKTRASDIQFFIEETGPKALPIVTLISLSVGMILAYLGSVQLRQLGAQVYVANLVSIGMVREMGALMTAIIVAGRTGAAYAAQLGTMQVNEEIDALKTMGVSSIEFLVLPRLLALVFVMPLLCIYADIIGVVGGALVASGMDVSFNQYILQTKGAVDWVDIVTGLFKSMTFGILIAVSGCQAGIACGRSSTAVGIATTTAVVRATVYIVLADTGFNVLFDKLGI